MADNFWSTSNPPPRPTQQQWDTMSEATRGWYAHMGVYPTQPEATAIPKSPALQELYARRDASRKSLEGFGESALNEQARGTGRNLAGVDIDAAKRGLYSTTVRNANRNRVVEAGAAERGDLQDRISTYKADTESSLTGDIAEMLSSEEDRRQGYAFQAGMGRAASRAQNRADMFQLAGTLGGGYLSSFRGGAGGGMGGGGGYSVQGGNAGAPYRTAYA